MARKVGPDVVLGGGQGHSNPSKGDDALETLRNCHSKDGCKVAGMVEDGHNKVVAASSLWREKDHASTSCHSLSKLLLRWHINHVGY